LDVCQANTFDPVKSSVLREYAAQIVIAERVPVEELLARVRGHQLPADECFRRVLREAQQVQDEKGDDVALHKFILSLNCPLSQMRMADPCRGANCEHLQCYDARFYLTVNSRRETWECPVCNKPAPLESLRVDVWMARVLAEADAGVVDIELQADGTWVPVADDDSDDSDSQRGDPRDMWSRKRRRVSASGGGGGGGGGSAGIAVPESVLASPVMHSVLSQSRPPPQQMGGHSLVHRLPWNSAPASAAPTTSYGSVSSLCPISQQLRGPLAHTDAGSSLSVDESEMQR
jgi:hypothetical protein